MLPLCCFKASRLKMFVVVELLSCVRLFSEPMDCSLSGSSVHGISLARILEWVAISFSRGSSWPRVQTRVSCIIWWILYHWTTWEALRLFISRQTAPWLSQVKELPPMCSLLYEFFKAPSKYWILGILKFSTYFMNLIFSRFQRY